MSSLDAGGLSEMGHRKVSGLRAHRGKDGRIYWITDTHVGGRPPKGVRVYESWGAISRDAAEQSHWETINIEKRRHRGIGPPPNEPENVAYTIQEVSKRWFNALLAAGREQQTIEKYERDLSYSFRYLSGKPLNEIKLDDVERMRAMIRTGFDMDGSSPLPSVLKFRTRQNIEHTTSMLFKFACHPSRAWAQMNPFSAMVADKPPKGSRRRSDERFRRLHPRDIAILLDACETDWHRCAVSIGLFLGVRLTAVGTIPLRAVNLFAEGGTICVFCEFNKGHAHGVREDLWLPISRYLYPHLRKQYEHAVDIGSEWLFPTGVASGLRSESGHVHPKKLNEALKRAATKIGYPEAMFKSLRAICNNWLRAAGIREALDDAATGARGVLGHGSEQAAQPYIDGDVERIRPVINAFDRWLDEMITKGSLVSDIRAKK